MFDILIGGEVLSDESIKKDIAIQSGRYNANKDEMNRGKTSSVDYRMENNNIRNALYDLIEKLNSDNCNFDKVNDLIEQKENKTEEFQPFEKWVFNFRKVEVWFSLLVIILGLGISVYGVTFNETRVKLWNSCLQFCFIFFTLFKTNEFRSFFLKEFDFSISENERKIIKRLEIDEKDEKKWYVFRDECNFAIGKFVDFWRVSWRAWLVLYLLMSINFKFESEDFIKKPFYLNVSASNVLWVIQNAAKNVSTVTFFLMFYALTVFTTNKSKKKRFQIVGRSNDIIFGCIIVSIGIELSSLYFGCIQFNFYIRLIYSLIAGIALMLVFARLLSKIMTLSILAGSVMCLYSIIQPLYSFLDASSLTLKNENVISLVPMSMTSLFFALFLKVWFFLVVTWGLKTGKILYLIAELKSWDLIKTQHYSDFIESVPTTKE